MESFGLITLFCYIMIVVLLLILLFTFVAIFWVHVLSYEIPTPKLIYTDLWRNIRAGVTLLKCFVYIQNAKNYNIPELFLKQVKRHPNKSCILFADQKWTFQQVEDCSNRVANAFAAAGYLKGDNVALFMENRPEYVFIWMGLSKIGVVVALINTHLKMESLAHSINVINCKAVIFSTELACTVKDAVPLLEKSNMNYYCLGAIETGSNGFPVISLEVILEASSKYPPERRSVEHKDKLFYLYTSGTTGFPKAAITTHRRLVASSAVLFCFSGINENDILYGHLPLYHMTGELILCSGLLLGGTVVIAKKFSASNFWTDSIKYNITVAPYIGEICRYLLHQPRRPEDTQHNIRLMCGNGLRQQIWEEFKNRFCIPRIFEFYGSTEGNIQTGNMFGKPGAVGFVVRPFLRIYPTALIKVDLETKNVIRNKRGLCVLCKPGEPGEIVSRIVRNHPLYPINVFDGYVDENETGKKILKNCFRKGDAVFRSGDILVMDEDGDLFFVDRTGDTFRWRGENVSTKEVEAIIGKLCKFENCTVYGVEVTGIEGKAGMLAIMSDVPIDMVALYDVLVSALPAYALPIFVRICKKLDITGTFKINTVQLQKDGFNPVNISDSMFFLDTKARSYVELVKENYNEIMNGKIRL